MCITKIIKKIFGRRKIENVTVVGSISRNSNIKETETIKK